MPEAWEVPAPSDKPVDLEQLMRQIAGGSVTSAAGVPATSLESLGISSDGLQQLLRNSGGGAAGGVMPTPIAANTWSGSAHYNQQAGVHGQQHYHQQQAQPEPFAHAQYGQHPGPPPPMPRGAYQHQAPGGRGGYAGAQGGPGGNRWGGR